MHFKLNMVAFFISITATKLSIDGKQFVIMNMTAKRHIHSPIDSACILRVSLLTFSSA